MQDIIEKLIVIRDIANLTREQRDTLADAANEIQRLRKSEELSRDGIKAIMLMGMDRPAAMGEDGGGFYKSRAYDAIATAAGTIKRLDALSE